MAEALLDRLRHALGPAQVLTDPAATEPYRQEGRGRFVSAPLGVVRPGTTAEVAACVAACAAFGVPIVPQGGNTGLVAGAVAPPGSVVLSLGRLNRIRALDPEGFTLTAEAGCVLADLQAASESVDRLFPLSLGAEGTCQIGGNLSANAGGILTLRYGNARDLCLGLEVVLADGRVWDGLRGLRKDTGGYDLKQLFLGSEGTLGIITAAVLKLAPRPRTQLTLLAGVPDPAAALALLARLRAASADGVRAFELFPRLAVELTRSQFPQAVDPLPAPAPWYALCDLISGDAAPDALHDLAEGALAASAEAGLVQDATLAGSERQRRELWFLREGLVQAARRLPPTIHHDVAVPVARVPAFIARATEAVSSLLPGARVMPFGHVGDGNIHLTVLAPPNADAAGRADVAAAYGRVNEAVHNVALALGGTIAAEHGIGLAKRAELARTKDALSLELMRRLKLALDPACLLNPGKVFETG